LSDIEVQPDPLRARPTMRDVAALAGVALKTVSRVMNGVPTVDPELAARVRAAADKLGYRPNLAASNLRRAGGRTDTVGLLVEDVGNPFSAALHRAVETVARTRGVLLLAGSIEEDAEREHQLARTLIDRRADGLIIVPAGSDYRWVVSEQQAGTAFVFVDRVPTPMVADAVLADTRRGAADGVAHLLTSGHRRIGYLGDSLSIQTAKDRYEGYRDTLESAGIGVDAALVRTDLRTVDAARAAALQLLRTAEPTALFASQNLVLIGAIHALHEAGLQDRIALVGLDDLALADLIRPAISVVAQDPATIGRIAAERLFARLDGDRSAPAVYPVPTRLIRRGSGEIPPPAT
jgi:LacI family transcriptional regulator